ncbi:MAG: M48 family metalloprotease [Pirellulaceae bacterium]|nr:M48 family metalloprotease [Pirellulaceae bacterium]
MRTLTSWISVCLVSLFAQVLTFVFSGVGIGYGFMVLQMYKLKRFEMARDAFGAEGPGSDFVTGLSNSDWVGVRDAIVAHDLQSFFTEMPILGWHFMFGFFTGGILAVAVINIATIYHLRRLAQGGQALAEKLGAFAFDGVTALGNLKHLPEILGELAAEFKISPPALYLLNNEEGMNAFVVGRKRDQSVLVVTQGLRSMSKTQLRGIVAHELAHIVNGDMVHNMRLLAVELGINGVRYTAEWMLRRGWSLLFGGASNHRVALFAINWGVFLLVTGVTLWPMGLISSLVGSAVMAMTNRRRELRADRLAARTLGSWEPIGEALKRIMGHDVHGRIAGPDGRKLGHLMFAQANGRSGGMLATHPKIERRIRRADRKWDGVALFEGDDDAPVVATETDVDDGSTAAVLDGIDAKTVELFRDPSATLLTIPALLLFEFKHRGIAAELNDGKLAAPVEALQGYLEKLDEVQRYALTEVTLQIVKGNPDAGIQSLLEQIRDAAPANAWVLQCWVAMFADAMNGSPTPAKVKYKNFSKCLRQTLEVISIGVSIGRGYAELRFQKIWGYTGLGAATAMCVDAYDFFDLEEAIDTLCLIPRKLREGLANGFANALINGKEMGAEEATFVRYLCSRLGVATPEKSFPGEYL